MARAEAPEVKPVNVKSAAIGQNASLHRQPARLLGGCTALPDLLQSSPQPASPVASIPGNCTSEESRAAHTSSPSREEEEAGACSPVLLF